MDSLSSHRRLCNRIETSWPAFLEKRRLRLAQQQRNGSAPEKIAENIVEDLLTSVLDWSLSDVNNQVSYADMVLTRLGIKNLIIEVKRPGSLRWNMTSVNRALDQASRYADEQKVRSIAVSDGVLIYARDLIPGGYRDRVFARLDSTVPQTDLWWLSVDGIYRSREDYQATELQDFQSDSDSDAYILELQDSGPLHPKYKLPYWCFAFVEDRNNPRTWHLPFLLPDGNPDLARLPKAIQAILTNYRGARVSTIPEIAIPEVLVTLAKTAFKLGKIPTNGSGSAATYVQLEMALEQLGRLEEAMG